MVSPGLMLVLLLATALIGVLLRRPVWMFLQDHGITATNYRGQNIPVGLGMYLWLLSMCYGGMLLLVGRVHNDADKSVILLYLLAISAVFIAGWLDDTVGDRTTKGFRGHWRALIREGRLSTGLGKAVVACAAAALWVLVGPLPKDWVVQAIAWGVIILCTNALNLLDVRPGRAWKGAMLLQLLAVASPLGWLYTAPLWIACPALLGKDLSGAAMLGDSGANVLGFACGIAIVSAVPLWGQGVLLVLLIVMHAIAEWRSLSELIERHRLLRLLDQLGRSNKVI